MSLEALDVRVQQMVGGAHPVFVTDLLGAGTEADVDAWVAAQAAGPRYGFLPGGAATQWRDQPVLVVPLDRAWPWRLDPTLRGQALYARACRARAGLGKLPVVG